MEREVLQTKLGEKIRDLRKKKGLTQRELAHLIGRDQNLIDRLENGRVNTTIYSLHTVATALEVGVRDLLEGLDI